MAAPPFSNRKCQESDLDELIPMVNDTYEVETGDSGIGFKCVKRLTSKDHARTYLSDLWILREDSEEIVGCVFAKVRSHIKLDLNLKINWLLWIQSNERYNKRSLNLNVMAN